MIKTCEDCREDAIALLDRAEAYGARLDSVAAKAREYAAHYPEGSDGRNTFVIFAEWAEALVTEESIQTSDSAPGALEREHQDFRLQSDREWKAKADHQKARAEATENALKSLLAAAEMTTFSDQFPHECEMARKALGDIACTEMAEARRYQISGISLEVALGFLTMFGGDETDMTLAFIEEGHSGTGFYCWCTEYPEDGAEFLGRASEFSPLSQL